jgi:hypothetical protein
MVSVQARDPVLTAPRSVLSFPGYFSFGSAAPLAAAAPMPANQPADMEVGTTDIPTTVDQEGMEIKEEDEVGLLLMPSGSFKKKKKKISCIDPGGSEIMSMPFQKVQVITYRAKV